METPKHESADAIISKAEDKKAILAIIEIYIVGLRSGRVDLLKKAFHDNAIMYGFSVENKTSEGNIERLYNTIEKNGPLPYVTSKNTILHLTDNTALVLAELKNTSPCQNSTDHLSLMKINGSWKIISKVYQLSHAH